MTADSIKGTVLITGASGYIAAHIITYFLEAGYKVVGTVRNQQSIENIRQAPYYNKFADRISFVEIEDISIAGAFDEAVKNVDGVIHTQSPFILNVKNDNEHELLIPAIKGTTELLSSIKKHNPSVRRVVITSSFAAIVDVMKGTTYDYTYSEKDWNPATYDEAKASPNGGFVYCASKSLAEKAAFDFVQQEKPNFTITSINPPVVYGPTAHHVASFSKLGESPSMFYSLMNGSRVESGIPETGFPAIVDVRDVALAHLLAYENPKAAGQRYLTTSGSFLFENICDILLNEFPKELKGRVPKPDSGRTLDNIYRVDNTKVKNDLGIEFRSLKETVVDAARDFLKLEEKLLNN